MDPFHNFKTISHKWATVWAKTPIPLKLSEHWPLAGLSSVMRSVHQSSVFSLSHANMSSTATLMWNISLYCSHAELRKDQAPVCPMYKV